MTKKERLRRELDALRVKMITLAVDKEDLLDEEVQKLSREIDQQILTYMKSCDLVSKQG
ncbi:Spo0E like sporulation regulatory protein [Orenia metallireducens]|uniref:Spo0E like sporulation regulatory protein n=1 Tax=Orenia metallireducens TaxID=1413210 RepID=A0A285F356_9FIRM|nr:aspartyl-phosphate phosphatase Spo0E family protein [Orenia metallireducens]PRX34808.1 Spo0E like sporulation regulatory protein [Orenia metallireducens]SNY05705.1 Spo0E like sporulation regulatory protein [Orenia metallireducens]